MKKNQLKKIRETAALLPPQKYEYVSYEKKEIQVPNKTGLKIWQTIFVPTVETNDVNHARRLKRAFKRNGNDGVRHYLNSIHARLRDSSGNNVH